MLRILFLALMYLACGRLTIAQNSNWEPDPEIVPRLGAKVSEPHFNIQPPAYLLRDSGPNDRPNLSNYRDFRVAGWTATGRSSSAENFVVFTYEIPQADVGGLDEAFNKLIDAMEISNLFRQGGGRLKAGKFKGLEARVGYFDIDQPFGKARVYLLFCRNDSRYFLVQGTNPSALANPQRLRECKAAILSLEPK